MTLFITSSEGHKANEIASYIKGDVLGPEKLVRGAHLSRKSCAAGATALVALTAAVKAGSAT